MNKMLIVIVSVAALVIVGSGVLWYYQSYPPTPTDTGVPPVGPLDAFAKCLAAKGVTMYGAEWCTHCKAEKKRFGSSFQYVPYVECPDNPKLCVDKGVEGYPTWILGDGTKLEGEQGLEKLSQVSSCPLPVASPSSTP
jgi:hypothetical protein